MYTNFFPSDAIIDRSSLIDRGSSCSIPDAPDNNKLANISPPRPLDVGNKYIDLVNKKSIVYSHKAFEKMVAAPLEDKSFFKKTLDVLKKAGEVVATPFKNMENFKKLCFMLLAGAALGAATFFTGGAAPALIALAAITVAIATSDFVHQAYLAKEDSRFPGDSIASAIYYLGNKIIDNMSCSKEDKTKKIESAAKWSQALSHVIRFLLAVGQACSTGLIAPLAPELLSGNLTAKLIAGSSNLVKPIVETLEKLFKEVPPKPKSVKPVPSSPLLNTHQNIVGRPRSKSI
ncbi:hypothetical protein [Aeromonas jandaei]|uniref:hypothetical protein n=1 Tax=Aeromonas jandaei TaxID=650 RepID=UPI0011172E0D|nr:hypothetical protein [Aeromonas jandaei]